MVTTIVSALSLSDKSMYLDKKPCIQNPESTVIALLDCEADEDDELSFKKGEKLNIIDKSDAEWWKATNSLGETGIIPSCFVEIVAPIEYEIISESLPIPVELD
ncbi:hypothetical protein MXB_5428, partial [Myxobolus squamalis]